MYNAETIEGKTKGSFLCALKYIAKPLIIIWQNHEINRIIIGIISKNLSIIATLPFNNCNKIKANSEPIIKVPADISMLFLAKWSIPSQSLFEAFILSFGVEV